MTRFLLLSLSLIIASTAIAQNTNLSDYRYVVVPEQFEFLIGKDQYKINSMAKFYFEKSGFNAYMADSAPNANRCDGLYADVEELRTLFGTKLQVVLKDCKENEIFRGQEGKSKYKEHDKSYQDALRKAFNGIEVLQVNQKDVVLLKGADISAEKPSKEIAKTAINIEPKVLNTVGNLLPDSKFSNYSNAGKSFLLRKTAEGYSLYEESTSAADGLLLKGKIIVMDKVVKFMDTSGNVSEATFDTYGNLTINDGSSSALYKFEN